MKPTEKNEEIEEFIDQHTQNPKGRRGSIISNECSFCQKPAINFRNEISKQEYRISGMCQDCQDSVFGMD